MIGKRFDSGKMGAIHRKFVSSHQFSSEIMTSLSEEQLCLYFRDTKVAI